jgi:hypothetical protein
MASLKMSRIPKLNTIVIRQDSERAFFIASPTSIVVSVDTLSFIIKFLTDNGYIDHEVLEGILEEYHSGGGNDMRRKNDFAL